jgi:hypothetical protein
MALHYSFLLSHEPKEVTPRDEREDHHELEWCDHQLKQRHDMRHVDQFQVELYLILDVLDEVLLCDLLLAHALETVDLSSLDELGDVCKSDHAAPNDPAELEPLDVRVVPDLLGVHSGPASTLLPLSLDPLLLKVRLRLDEGWTQLLRQGPTPLLPRDF